MKLVQDDSLAERLAAWRSKTLGPFAVAEAVALVKKIANAVHYAHQNGVLHLGIKPGHIL